MSFLTQKQYAFTLFLQHILLLFDVCANSFSTFLRSNPTNLLILFIIQDFCLIVAFSILLINIFATYVFQAGLIKLLFVKFRMTLIICVIYIILSISLHCWHVKIHYTSPLSDFWPTTYHCLYSLHKTTAVLYYYLSRRTSLRISDPRFHKGSNWIQKQFSLN
ncbi:PREDICTED: transmembrane protein 138 [Ceratosolen solmsi marchali]|uniref:Transmembrane protein 138 n=1 Tax=Ceratosolen solmsi marchali TaxID=326594 RepID=A0AAJ6VMG4_9HYME|nr:PREDICTED: transmembrane protein 138 [Ceratosolen solmsi marchali]